ncbi:hypothetical protein D7V86_10890 [bacterium D16-51]|nr:hypothetical protein D7V96_11655 [bacterium D16-59]RKI59831.1 hypothetical protein D7V86_10890 [bacterium D16-51]
MDKELVKQILKKAVRKVFFLPPAPTLLISVPAYVLVIYALAGKNVEPAIQYAAYFLSAYALIITVTGITGVVRFVRQGIDKHPLVGKMLGIPFVSKYLKEATFRAEASLYQGFFINLLYAGIKLLSGILYRSVWFITLAVYYILLALMRASLLHYVRTDKKSRVSEWRRYRLCGMILLFMNVALAGIVVLVVYENSGFEYPGVLIYVMAVYAFYAAIMAVRNVVRFRKYGSPVMSAAKAVSLTAALVSMLSLETAMLTQFGAADDPMFRRIMTASTGAAVSITVLGMAVFMIIRSCREITLNLDKSKGKFIS